MCNLPSGLMTSNPSKPIDPPEYPSWIGNADAARALVPLRLGSGGALLPSELLRALVESFDDEGAGRMRQFPVRARRPHRSLSRPAR